MTSLPHPPASPVARTAAPTAAPTAPDGEVRIVREIPFGDPDAQLKLDLYLPQGPGPWPTTVYFHGGGWRTGTRTDYAERCVGLAQRGIAVASADYRLAPLYVFPAQLHDVAAAVDWVHTHGARHGLSTHAIGAWGASAGGHLASLLGTGRTPAVAAVAALFAPLHLGERRAADPDGHEAVLTAGADARRRHAADPSARAVLGAVPFLLAHGDADTRVEVTSSTRFHSELVDRGGRSTLLLVSGAEHEDAQFGSDLVLSTIAAFFREALA